MNWKGILKGKKRISTQAKKLIDKLITTTPKSINTILDDMYNQIENQKPIGNFSGKHTIPTRRELVVYLNANYSKVNLSERTNKPVKVGGIVHYYKEE